MAFLHHIPYTLRLCITIKPKIFLKARRFYILPDRRFHLAVSQHVHTECKTALPQFFRKAQDIFRMLQRNEPAGPHDMQPSVLKFHGRKLLLAISTQRRKIPPAEHFIRIGADQAEIGCRVSARA